MRRSTSPIKVLKPCLPTGLMTPAAMAADRARAMQVNMSSFWSRFYGESVSVKVTVRWMGMEMGTLGEID